MEWNLAKKGSGSEESLPLLLVAGYLPVDTDVEADLSLGTGCAGDTAERSGFKRLVANYEVRVVEHIEHNHPELDIASL